MSQKLSDLMERGAAMTLPLQGRLVQHVNDQIYACAFGCSMVALGTENTLTVYKAIGYFVEDMRVDWNSLPQDIQALLSAQKLDYRHSILTLRMLIMLINDKVSRERAIQLTRELGF